MLTSAIVEVIFEYMRANKLPKSGVYILPYPPNIVNPCILGNC